MVISRKLVFQFRNRTRLFGCLIIILSASVYVNVVFAEYFFLNNKRYTILESVTINAVGEADVRTAITLQSGNSSESVNTKTTVTNVRPKYILPKYESDFMNCTTLNNRQCNGSEINLPFRMCIDTPQPPYPECGVRNLLRPEYIYGKTWMLFLVKSAPGNFEKRNSLRRTWGWIKSIRNKTFSVIFVIGRVESEDKQELLDTENQLYNDILQCDFDDSYHNLTLKLLSSFRWVLASELQVDFISSCDDDVILDMWNLFIYFTEFGAQRNWEEALVCGYFKSVPADLAPHRNKKNKWYVSKEVYSAEKFPTYCYGALYTMSRRMLNDIYCVAEHTNATDFFIDDVLIAGVLRIKASPKFTVQNTVLPKKNETLPLLYYSTGRSSKEKANHIQLMQNKWKDYYFKLKNNPYKKPNFSNISLNFDEVTFRKGRSYGRSTELILKWKELNKKT